VEQHHGGEPRDIMQIAMDEGILPSRLVILPEKETEKTILDKVKARAGTQRLVLFRQNP
jgi:hypothetical protein